jgi:hypothetical protein
MANNDDVNEKWVEERLAALDGGGELRSDVVRARGRLGIMEQAAAKRVRRMWLAFACVLLALAALPWPRAIAQQLWNRLLVGRVEVVQVGAGDEEVPEEIAGVFTMDLQPFEPRRVADAAEAERLAGFRPLFPPPGILKGTPALFVVPSVALSTRPLKVADIERALAAAGVSGVTVPKEWEGTTLVAEGGPVVVAEYEGVQVMQSAPFRVNTSPGFRFGRFMEIAFRVFGRSAGEAKALAEKFEANPALVVHFPKEDAVREVALRSGQGIIVGEPGGPENVCFFWNTSDRIYIVDAMNVTEEMLVTLANSMR